MILNFRKVKTLKWLKEADEEGRIPNGNFVWCDETERLYIYMKDKLIGITPAKRKIRQIKCKSCGAPLSVDGKSSIVKCEYCKSVYDIDNFDMEPY